MIKKILLGTAGVAVLSSFVVGRDVVTYTRAAWSSAREAVKREVPPEMQISVVREAVARIQPQVETTLKTIAEQQVDIEHLSRDIACRTDEMKRQKHQMLTLRHDLESGQTEFRYANASYSANDVRRDLHTRLTRYKTFDSLLERDRRILAARKQALFAYEKQLDTLLTQKKDLEAKIEQIDARLQTIRAEQQVASSTLDTSALADAKRLMSDLDRQLDVQQKQLDVQGKFVGLIPVDVKPAVDTSNITAEVDQFFGTKPAPAAKAVAVR